MSPALNSPLAMGLIPTYDRAAFTHYVALTQTRLAAAALALRAYAADHDGAMPSSLDDLVPQYLPALPADPLVAAPATLLYRDGMVYSAGINESPRRRTGAATKTTIAPSSVTAKPDFAIRVIK
jgi:hypothetical protein